MKPPKKKRKLPHPKAVDALSFPRFSGIATFMRLPHITDASELDIALIGIPYDGGTTYRPGPRFGPRHVRQQSSIIRPWNPALNVDPFSKWRIADFGDLSINPLSLEDTFGRITNQLNDILAAGARTACVGGDHSILLPILRAIHKRFGPVALIQFDAHNDTWGGYFGSPHSHGTPVRRAVEEGLLLPKSTVQVGLRGQVYSREDFDFGKKHGFQVMSSEDFHRGGVPAVERLSEALERQARLRDARHRRRRSSLRSRHRHAASWRTFQRPDHRLGPLAQRSQPRRMRSRRSLASLRQRRADIAPRREPALRIAVRNVISSARFNRP